MIIQMKLRVKSPLAQTNLTAIPPIMPIMTAVSLPAQTHLTATPTITRVLMLNAMITVTPTITPTLHQTIWEFHLLYTKRRVHSTVVV